MTPQKRDPRRAVNADRGEGRETIKRVCPKPAPASIPLWTYCAPDHRRTLYYVPSRKGFEAITRKEARRRLLTVTNWLHREVNEYLDHAAAACRVDHVLPYVEALPPGLYTKEDGTRFLILREMEA